MEAPPHDVIPLRGEFLQPCETLAIPQESELPAVSEDPAIRAAQLIERQYWTGRDIAHEGVEQRICRQRNEIVAIVQEHNR